VICLVQHALDPMDVLLFASSMETIKLSNGQLPNTVPLLVRKEIFNSSVFIKTIVQESTLLICMIQIMWKFLNCNIEVWEIKTRKQLFESLGKTLVWAIAHCLEQIVFQRKRYNLEKSTFEELGVAADNAFLIEGIINVKNPPKEVNEQNKHIPCGPKMYYVKDSKGNSEVCTHLCPPLYSIHWEIFFSHCHCKNTKT